SLLPGTLLDMLEQFAPALVVAVIRVHGNTGKLADPSFIKRVQGGAADHHAIAFDNGETLDLAFQQFARAPDQHAGGFHRLDQLENTADILDVGAAYILVQLTCYQRAASIAGKQLLHHRAVFTETHQVRARHA